MADTRDSSGMKWGFATRAIHSAGGVDPTTGAVNIPIYQSNTFSFPTAEAGAGIFAGEEDGFVYTRIGNPTVRAFEKVMASLEGGTEAVAFASGMAATSAVIMSYCESGSNVVLGEPSYGGTHALVCDTLPRFGVEAREVDALDLDEVRSAIDDKTGIVWLETPANPTLKVADIAAVAEITGSAGVPLAVDNTFATPYFQQPLQLGAQIVMHSATKYICGHGDAIGGIIVSGVEPVEKIRDEMRREFGGALSPFNAWLFIRGLKTLQIRMERHAATAMKVAEYLSGHPKVEKVSYPGLQSHPQHEIAAGQMSGYGGMVTFFVKGGRQAGATLLNSVKLCILAVSLGDCDTLIEHPASTTHSTYSTEEMARFNIAENLIRISVGLENSEDIIADLDQSLEKI
jgi:methionine-gamma-lyase